ncbi:gamma-secretase subunit Aph-1 [Gorgonomyces haynaldii]|nr:gamma-secretase subunit Aph-1 [Gorgonomyces haynaldii]
MTLLTFFGRLLTAFGPSTVFLITYIGPKPTLVLLGLSACLFWLIGILIVSIFWYFIPGMHNLIVIGIGSLVQELVRYLLFLVLYRAQDTLIKTEVVQRNHQFQYAVGCGFGFGLMSALVSYIDPLIVSIGPAKLDCQACPQLDVLFLGAILALLFQILHLQWGIIVFHGWQRNSWLEFVFVLMTHYVASASTLFLSTDLSFGCAVPIIVCLVLILGMSIWIRWIVIKIKHE